MAGSSASIPCVALNTGHAIPVLGFGTGSSSTPEDLAATILHTVRLGYCHIDTASVYGAEGAVSAVVADADAVAMGVVTSHVDLFITSKLWMNDAHPDRILLVLRESLARLSLDYLDLFLVHCPLAADENKKPVPFDMEGIWRPMEECHRLGLARSIGVSNFSAGKMSRLLAFAAVPPTVNQVELNVDWRQEKVREVCVKNGVVVTAFSPLGTIGTMWGSNAVMESGVLQDIATKRGKMIAQVALRWLHEQGMCFVARSFNKERLKQNKELFDWELSDDDKEKIMGIPQRRACHWEFFLSPDGPYKTLEELWDGEI